MKKSDPIVTAPEVVYVLKLAYAIRLIAHGVPLGKLSSLLSPSAVFSANLGQ